MFCWDDAKNETNIEKHGIGFAAAALLFEGLTVEVPDTRHAYGETRINQRLRLHQRPPVRRLLYLALRLAAPHFDAQGQLTRGETLWLTTS
ncbi:ribonuclease toxin BrnT of type II toxin-antitoxin system [Azospirillum baldaniorum]|uniref:BrnT family toxin n=1 Tax=Azospirillum baldaniorum TaxID=1064539 RepID=UPI0011AD3D59|nr:BrnT family toxin [Azospirillum baldaniorum]TWA55975.1 ribonuclease toxin BrnT of type II toxin-antitoxin system [Azospirillum baldaniorum]